MMLGFVTLFLWVLEFTSGLPAIPQGNGQSPLLPQLYHYPEKMSHRVESLFRLKQESSDDDQLIISAGSQLLLRGAGTAKGK